jgi:hypothetical protein
VIATDGQITDKSHVPGGDELTMRLKSEGRESFMINL